MGRLTGEAFSKNGRRGYRFTGRALSRCQAKILSRTFWHHVAWRGGALTTTRRRGALTMKACLYARVSTTSQDPEVQLEALRTHATQRGWQVVEEFIDRGVSGAKERRPALDRLLKAAWAGHFHVVLVWRFDRFARSVKHLVAALETFRNLNVGFVSLHEQLDTSSPIAKQCSPSSAPWPSSSGTSFVSESRPDLIGRGRAESASAAPSWR